MFNTKADQAQQVMNEFDIFRENQQQLIKNRFVIKAALRDPNLNNRACIAEQDAKHNAEAWLTNEIHADFQTKNASLMTVSATELDPQDAAAIVNAVVGAYWNEVVMAEQRERRIRLNELTEITHKKEAEVRTKREQYKQELANIGAATNRPWRSAPRWP